jgi:3-oxoacyl-[acyl-carrier protein] reductase
VFSLAGRCALLTGAAGALGTAVADALLGQGADVAIADLRGDVADTAVGTLSQRHPDRHVIGLQVDVTDEPSVVAGVARAVDAVGSPDIVVAAAGIGETRLVEEMSFDEWRRMIAIHLDGTFLTIRHAVAGMLERRWGRVICFSSIASLQGVEEQAHYAAGKGGVDGLVRSFSREVASRGVTVNAIAPGYIESPLNESGSPERIAALTSNVPIGRFGHPREIGALAAYLASDEAAYLTGQIISPNGGFVYCNHLGD